MILTTWSSQGLIAHYDPSQSDSITLLDQNVGICDPFYRQSLKLTDNSHPLVLLQWNSLGTLLLCVNCKGSIEIFRQNAGVVNQWESIYSLNRNNPLPIYAIWCENRRTFSYNSNHLNNNKNAINAGNNTANSPSPAALPFSSKVFHLNFLPSGRNCFLLISSNGLIEIFIENSTAGHFDIFTIPSSQPLKDALAYQRPNGKICISLLSNEFLGLYEIGENNNLSFSLNLISQIAIKSESLVKKFIWSEAKESLIHLETDSFTLKMTFYNTNLTSTSKSIDLPIEINAIFNSSRAANYIFLKSSQDDGSVLILNLNGEIVKQLCMETERTEFDEICATSSEFTGNNSSEFTDNNSSGISPIIISPNGLVVAKIVKLDGFPLMINSPIGEIHPKNVQMLREFLGKLISSTLNSLDPWDIFQLIRKSLQKCPEDEYFPFISTILAEWVNLLDSANLPARDFYPKLLDLFKMLPCGYDAYNLVDMGIKFSCLEKIILANLCDFEDFYYAEMTKWPETEKISIIPESLVSLVPILEEGLNLIKNLIILPETELVNVTPASSIYLLTLNEEIYKSIGLIWMTAQSAQKQLKFKLTNFRSSEALGQFYNKIHEELSQSISKLESFINFLISLKTETQIQTKFTKNLFHFMTEFYFDTTNTKKILTILQRISSSRFDLKSLSSSQNDSNGLLFDSIKFLNLPVKSVNFSVLICRKCHRASMNSKINKSRRELIFSADWQQSLWKMRCQCGSLRRQV